MMTHLFFRPEVGLLMTLADAQAMFPFVRPNTDDAALEAVGLHRLVSDGEPPKVGRYELLVEVLPELKDGRYLRRYRVDPMFPGPVCRYGTPLSVEDQKRRYDAGRLAEAKVQALAQIDDLFGDAVGAGLRLDDGVVVDLDDAAAQLRNDVQVSYFGADEMPLFLRGGAVKQVASEVFFGVLADASRRRVGLHLRRAELRARVEGAQSQEELDDIDLSFSIRA